MEHNPEAGGFCFFYLYCLSRVKRIGQGLVAR
jgi:hypothetical protein